MKLVSLSNKDTEKKGGSKIDVYNKFIECAKGAGIEGQHHFVTDTRELLSLLREFEPDVVYSGAYYTDDGDNVHEVLDANGVPYIGSSPEALELVISKSRLKEAWRDAGVPTPDFVVVRDGDVSPLKEAKNFPYIVKPATEGNSRGMDEGSVVHNPDELRARCELLHREFGYDDILAEKYMGRKIREFTIGIIGEGDRKIVMPAELVCRSGVRPLFIDTSMKDDPDYKNREVFAAPLIDQPRRDQVIELAGLMFDVAGVRDYARCDILTDEEGNLGAIEINGQSQIESYFITGGKGVGMDECQTRNAIFLAG
ncbi:MAG: hypothetical protein ACE5DM_03640, partial [Candidatus Nanoarchaeia archaeon]